LDSSRFPLAGRRPGRGLAALAFHADPDGAPELFVANDGGGSFYFRKRDESYEEAAYTCGLALSAGGADPAGMGVDVADVDADGMPDLALGNFQDEPNLLYRQQAGQLFRDVSTELGLGHATRGVLTFGAGFEDFDLDGRPELLFVNGHVQDNIGSIRSGVDWAQRPQLFRMQGGTYQDLSSQAGPAFQAKLVGRGAAFADYDRDGDVDVAVSVNGGRVQLWRNDSRRGHWLQVELKGKKPNTNALGARVSVTNGGAMQTREVMSGRSYLSDMERVLTFGLGERNKVDALEVRWPNGARQTVRVEGVDRRLTVEQE
jgi:hypothetical protein